MPAEVIADEAREAMGKVETMETKAPRPLVVYWSGSLGGYLVRVSHGYRSFHRHSDHEVWVPVRGGGWNPHPETPRGLAAAVEKSECYHYREPHFVVPSRHVAEER